jgi:hypothetical protein
MSTTRRCINRNQAYRRPTRITKYPGLLVSEKVSAQMAEVAPVSLPRKRFSAIYVLRYKSLLRYRSATRRQSRLPLRIICVDIAMSDHSSAIHNTGHYHVRPRPVCLSPSCARSANNGQSRRRSCVLASLDLATLDASAVTKDSAYRLQRTCAESAAEVLGLVFVRSQFGEGSRRDGGKQTVDRTMAR